MSMSSVHLHASYIRLRQRKRKWLADRVLQLAERVDRSEGTIARMRLRLEVEASGSPDDFVRVIARSLLDDLDCDGYDHRYMEKILHPAPSSSEPEWVRKSRMSISRGVIGR